MNKLESVNVPKNEGFEKSQGGKSESWHKELPAENQQLRSKMTNK
jgi:hypothetical protein